MWFKKLMFVAPLTLLFFVAACQDGPAEEAGESIDEAVEETREAAEETGEAVDEAIEEVEEE